MKLDSELIWNKFYQCVFVGSYAYIEDKLK